MVRLLAAEGDRTFSIECARQLSPRVGLKGAYLGEALYHLRRNGWIFPLRRGLYALAPALPGLAPAHEYEVPMALVKPVAISHWSALSYHGLTEQVPRRVFVLTAARSVPRVRGAAADGAERGYPAGGTIHQFVQVKPARFFGTEEVWVNEARVTITDPERTLLDGLTRPWYCGDVGDVLHAFDVRAAALDVDRIIRYALRLDAATAKRPGWVLTRLGIAAARLEPLRRVPIKGYRVLEPRGPRRGRGGRRRLRRRRGGGLMRRAIKRVLSAPYGKGLAPKNFGATRKMDFRENESMRRISNDNGGAYGPVTIAPAAGIRYSYRRVGARYEPSETLRFRLARK